MRSQSSTEQGLTLTIKCPEILISGAENYVAMTLRNDGEQAVEFRPIARQFPAPRFDVMLRGEPAKRTEWGETCLTPNYAFPQANDPIRIGKGQELSIVANVTRYYDLSVPDHRYQIAAAWWGTVVGKEDPIRIQTKALDFKVIEKPGESVSIPGQ